MKAASMCLLLMLLACGQPPDSAPAPAPAPTPAPGSPTTPPTWATIAPIVASDCGPCHNGSKEPAFTSGDVFKASAAKAKLQAGLMPPSGSISAADKAALLAYLGS